MHFNPPDNMRKHVKKYILSIILSLYLVLMITLIFSDYSYESYDQELFNSSRFPKTIFIELTEEEPMYTKPRDE